MLRVSAGAGEPVEPPLQAWLLLLQPQTSAGRCEASRSLFPVGKGSPGSDRLGDGRTRVLAVSHSSSPALSAALSSGLPTRNGLSIPDSPRHPPSDPGLPKWTGSRRTQCWIFSRNTPCEVRGKAGEMQSLKLVQASLWQSQAGSLQPWRVRLAHPQSIILWKVPAHPEPSPAHPRTSPSLLPQGGTPGLEKFIPEVLHGCAPSPLPREGFSQGRMLSTRGLGFLPLPQTTWRHLPVTLPPGEGFGSWDSCL